MKLTSVIQAVHASTSRSQNCHANTLLPFFLLVDGWGFSRLPVEYREGPNMTAHSVTSCTSADTEDPEVPADPVTEEFQCGLQKTSEQSRRHLKSKIRAETNRLLSSLHCIHSDTVLQHLFGALHKARILAEENVTTSSGIAVRGSPTKGCSGVAAKKKKEHKHHQQLELQ